MNGKKIFISGGAGVIGRELTTILCQLNANILVGDLKPRPKDFPNQVLYRQGDLNTLTKEEIEQFNPEIFIHLAATFERTTETYDFWQENFLHNVSLSHHLATLLKESPSLKKIIFASSYLIYDQSLYTFNSPQKRPVTLNEADPIFPRNLTGSAKLAHEIELHFLRQFKHAHLSTVSVRIFRGFGRGSNCVISKWIRSALANKPIQVFRKEGLFDYIFSNDTAMGLAKLAQLDSPPEIINLGTGKARKVSEVLNYLKAIFPNLSIEEIESDIPYEASQADMSQFKAVCNWTPQHTLETAIPLIVAYEKQHRNNTETPHHILITSASQKIPLIRAVQNAAKTLSKSSMIIGADSNPYCIAAYLADKFWHMPKLNTLSIKCIIDTCANMGITAIIPTRDQELLFFSQNKNTLAKHNISIMVSDTDTIQLCLDKLKFYNELKEAKLPVIPSYKNIDDISEPSTQLVVKEQYGAGGKNLAINVDKKTAIKVAKSMHSPIFQPYISGKEVSVDMYVDKKNKLKGCIMRHRNVVVDGESKVTTTFHDPTLAAYCTTLSQIKKFYGHIMIQAIRDKYGHYHIIECNPRFGGASTVSVHAGLNSFYWFLLESSGIDIETYPFVHNNNIKLKQIRYPENLIQICNDTGF